MSGESSQEKEEKCALLRPAGRETASRGVADGAAQLHVERNRLGDIADREIPGDLKAVPLELTDLSLSVGAWVAPLRLRIWFPSDLGRCSGLRHRGVHIDPEK